MAARIDSIVISELAATLPQMHLKRTKDDHVLGGGDSTKNTCICLVHTVAICIIKDSSLTQLWGTIACAPRLFPCVDIFNIVRPDKVEYCIIRGDHLRGTNHALRFVLIQLDKFRFIPIVPIILLK